MLSICSSSSSSLRLLQRNPNLWLFLHSQSKTNNNNTFISCSKDKSASIPKQIKVRYDPSEDFFGLEVDIQPRNASSRTPKQKSWFGPNGQYIRELPCPSCRGRGYTPCTECDIERSRSDCTECNGKGMKTCQQCAGECVIWEETIDERPWERARSISPVKVKEDDDVDNLDIKLDTRKKSKRVYHSPTREVGLKISQSLKLNDCRI
ncbi:hypothetical protein ACHQM5_006131 [Ranunculus cassubicifolius]